MPACSILRFCAGLVIVGLLMAPGVPSGYAQPSGGAIMEVQDAFARGDFETLLDRAASRMEIALLEGSRYYSRGQARYVLKTFFERHPPRRFVLKDYYRTTRGWYAEGDYWYANGARPLRVYLKLRYRGGVWELREILVEEEARK